MIDKDVLNDFEEQIAINEIVEKGFAGRKASRIWQWQLTAVVAAIIIGISAFGFTFPALAQHIPIIGGIFARIELHGEDRLSSLANYATLVGETQISDGISVTLSELFFDGDVVYLTYLVEGDRNIANVGNGIDHGDGQDALAINDFLFFEGDLAPKLIIDDVINPLGELFSTRVEYYPIDDYSFFFIVTIAVSSFYDLTNANHVEISLNLRELFRLSNDGISIEAQGPWDFRVSLEPSEYEMIVINQTIHQDGFDVTIHDLVISPARMRIDFSYVAPFIIPFSSYALELNDLVDSNNRVLELTDAEITSWVIVDDLGNTMFQSHGGKTILSRYYAHGHAFFHVIHPDAKQITIMLTGYITSGDLIWNDDEEGGGVSRGESTINRIEFEPIIIDLP